MSFLGRKITPQLKEELGSRLSTRIEGTCIKHQVGPVSIKMYDKFERVLRIATTVNDVSFFKHHREVEHKDRPPTRELAAVEKRICSLDRPAKDSSRLQCALSGVLERIGRSQRWRTKA